MPPELERQQARAALASIQSEPWAMYEPELLRIMESLEHVVRTGENPSPPAILTGDVGGRVNLPAAIAALPAASYSSRVRLAGSTAIVPVVGPIRPRPDALTRWYGGTACSDLQSDLAMADADPNIGQVILWCDSPGGSVLGLDETASLIFKMRSGKTPVNAFTDGMCASACYWLASAAGKHTATPASLIGSIGVILLHADFSRAYADFGIDLTVVTFGKHKGDASPYKPLGVQGKQTLQELVDDTGKLFVGAVARHRGVQVTDVRSRFGDGKVFLAEVARQKGLIDAVGTLTLVPVQEGNEEEAEGKAKSSLSQSSLTQFPLTLTLSPNGGEGTQKQLTASPHGGEGTQKQLTVSQHGGEGTQKQNTAAEVSVAIQSATSASAAPRNSFSGGTKESFMNARIKAYLFAAGFVADVSASDEVYQVALKTLCVAAGITLSDNTDEALRQLASIKPQQAGAGASLGTGSTNGNASLGTGSPTARAQAALDQELAEAREAGRQSYLQRRDSIEALAATINAGRQQPVINAEQIRTAIDGNQTLADIQSAWKTTLTAETPDNRRLNPPITMGTSGEDLFASHAVDALLCRINPAFVPQAQRPANGYGELRNMSLFQMAQRSLQLTNRNADLSMMARDQIASMALQSGGNAYGLGVGARVPYGMDASSPAFNRPADFPNLMSNLMGKLMDRYMALAAPTYQHYSDRMPDTDDFKPSILIAVATFTTLDAVKDGQKYPELKMAEEVQGWIAVERFGNSIQLTPVMVANDDLDGIMQQVRTLAYAHENTMNTLNLELVTGNVKLPDGVALFHTSHNNIVTAGGPPSATEAEKMKLIHQRQKGINTDKTIRSTPKVVLAPPALETAAEQTYMPIHRLVESKVAQTDAALNVHRGRTVHTIAVEPDLEGYTNGTIKWWTFDDPTIHRVIAHQFMTGYGSGGRRTMWYDPASDCRFFALEGRMGVAAVGYRGAAQNNGTGA